MTFPYIKACVDEAGVSTLCDLVLQEPPTGGSEEV